MDKEANDRLHDAEVEYNEMRSKEIDVIVGSSEAPEEFEELSACCGAPIIMEAFCSDCKEGCK